MGYSPNGHSNHNYNSGNPSGGFPSAGSFAGASANAGSGGFQSRINTGNNEIATSGAGNDEKHLEAKITNGYGHEERTWQREE